MCAWGAFSGQGGLETHLLTSVHWRDVVALFKASHGPQ